MFASFVIALSLLAAEPGSAKPENAIAPNGVTNAAPAPAAKPPVLQGEPAAALEAAVRKYRDARTYADTVVTSWQIEFDGPAPGPLPEPTERTIVFERPNRLALTTDLWRVVCDGTKLYEAVEPWMEYRETDAPSILKVDNLALSEFPFFDDTRHPLVGVLLGGEASPAFLGKDAALNGITDETLEGVPGRRVRGTVLHEQRRVTVPVEVWIDAATGLIGEIVYDNTEAVGPVPGLRITKYARRYRFRDVRLDQAVADASFRFEPGPRLDKTEKLAMPTGAQLQQRMIGKPVVDFTGKDLEGKPVSLADFKDRVLLLDFWSQRCGPCIMAMPTLQKISDKYADKPVSVVGVNLDGPGAGPNVAALLKNREISFRQLLETQPSLAEQFFVQGIPFMAIIDGKGIIQAIHHGIAMEAHLTAQIDKLLGGENLFGRR